MSKGTLYKFEDFEIDPVRRQMCRAGVPVPVTQKAFQLLLFLLENPGRVLTKTELMNAVWPQANVEESNLTQSIFLLRRALGEQPGRNRFIVTVPGEGYQFAIVPLLLGEPQSGSAPEIERAEDIAPVIPESAAPPHAAPSPDTSVRRGWVAIGVAVPILAAAVATWIWYARPRPKLPGDGNLVLADFANKTSDSAFDEALRQGLAAQLEQSPYLGLISDARIAQTMKMMTRPKEERLTPELARQVCERTGSAAVVEGSIANLGRQYVLGLRALNCKTGDTLALDQETADSKEKVLPALGIAAGKLRRRLGESLSSVQKYDTPPEDVTTGSLEALEAYSLGLQAQIRGDCLKAVPLYKQAIAHDPEFAMAYSHLGVCDASEEGVNATRKAYLLRNRVSDREKFYLASHYEQYATGDLPAARKILETWWTTYPHDGDPPSNLLKLYLTAGEYERALPLAQAIVQNSPGTPVSNASRLATTLLYLNRTEEAKTVLLDAAAHHNDVPVHHYFLYEIAFLQNDSAAMAKEAAYVRAQPGWTGNMLELESATACFFGKFALSRSLSDQSTQTALRERNPEDAAGTLAEGALEEALVGNKLLAETKSKASLALSRTSEVETLAGMAVAFAGDPVDTTRMLEDMNRRFPADTLAQAAIAVMRASMLLGTGKSPDQARRALEAIAPAIPYALSGTLYLVPIYVRAQAYLASGQSANAAADFQAILDHPGVTRGYVTGPLARLGLAKAEEQAGDTAKARTDYAEFLRLWRDADTNLSILKAARTSFDRVSR